MKGNRLDLSTNDEPATSSVGGAGAQDGDGRPYLGVKFECCSVYARVYANRRGDAYEGRCPRCATPIRFAIGPGGTSSRFFTAS